GRGLTRPALPVELKEAAVGRKAFRAALVAAALAALTAGCGGGRQTSPETAGPDASPSEPELAVAVASFDLAVGDGQRFIAGVFLPDRKLIGFGAVQMEFYYLGEKDASGRPEPVAATTATFLPVPGKEPRGSSDSPALIEDPEAAGVYETTLDLTRPGFWGVAVVAEVEGETRRGTASFQVLPDHQVPTVGDPAPRSHNLTLASDAPKAAIDSRAGTEGEIPDPHLHGTTVADALAQGRPAVVVVSTPVYCMSRFCGPITDTVAELAETYQDRAAFIHIEVWRDFNAGQLDEAAAQWIQTPQGGNEPWVFLVGSDGKIAARWDNVLDRAELEQRLQALPVRGR
ncbi:MAG: hypothetical protein M3N32_07460, partial [Actinomycetota bacterium]|nr:hypothetical protein [Actinomycetota bacterium]